MRPIRAVMRSGFNSVLRSVLRSMLRTSAWAMMPFCLGLMAALLLVLAQFARELAHVFADFSGMKGQDVILAVLRLLDLVLLANLVIMVVIAGIEIFAPGAPEPGDHRPEWSGIMDFAGLKPKLFASISAIAAIDLLESFINIEAADKSALLWEVLILLTFITAGAVLAWMEQAGHKVP